MTEPSPETESHSNSATNSDSSAWADVGIVAVHLAVLAYPVWLLGWRVPEYLNLLEQYQTKLSPDANRFAAISEFFVDQMLWFLPLFLLLFLACEIRLVKKSENKSWRKYWLLGMILIPFGLSAWIQSTFFLILQEFST